MADIQLPEGPHEIESLMREIGRLLAAASEATTKAAAPPPFVLTGITTQDLVARLDQADRTKHPAPNYRIRSHRPVIGRFLDFIKRIAVWTVRPQFDQLADNQDRHNESLLQLQHALIGAVDELRRNNEALRAGVTGIQAALAEVRSAFERLAAAIEADRATLGCRVEALAVSGAEIGNRIPVIEAACGRIAPLEAGLARVAGQSDPMHFFDSIGPQARLELMNRTRGSRELIRSRFAKYLDGFKKRPGPVLDLGCGRGEFLEMLRESGIPAWGCDTDPAMVDACGALSLDARCENATAALESLPPGSLGGVFCAQVIEHLFPADLLRMIALIREKLAPGGVVIIESLNPQSLGVLARSYYRDLEHKQPVDPEYLAQILEAAGFTRVRWEGVHPFDPGEVLRFPAYTETLGLTRETHAFLELLIQRINSEIWGAQDYFVTAEAPPAARQ